MLSRSYDVVDLLNHYFTYTVSVYNLVWLGHDINRKSTHLLSAQTLCFLMSRAPATAISPHDLLSLPSFFSSLQSKSTPPPPLPLPHIVSVPLERTTFTKIKGTPSCMLSLVSFTLFYIFTSVTI